MQIESAHVGAGTARIRVAGELDTANAGLLLDEVLALLSRDQLSRMIIDMHLVTLVDSTALGTLVSCHRAAAAAGATLTIQAPSPFVRRVLWVSGLLGLFGLAPPAVVASPRG
ncbi:STAS domain-containing protein [Asanoa sp. WMMD1127]|uniref:STAS domain-containing protein n=1 Tax=Asanoa sp. WMMD1127 TaxID=3016107 RepID=UPI002416E894|nr:STAS domain-containing protein [Asanoa sp. WMMD1127]MDG4824967.1 STAS domain-containing protein [Asanoa sp. WMMD1127]